MKKLLLIALLTIAMVLTFVACGGDEVETSAGTKKPTATTAATTADESEPDATTGDESTSEPGEETTGGETTGGETTGGDTTTATDTTEPGGDTTTGTEVPPEPDPDAPQLLITPEFLKEQADQVADNGAKANQMTAEMGEGYITLLSAGGDPYVTIIDLNTTDGPTGKFMAIKYRTEGHNQGQVFIGAGAGWSGNGDNPTFNYENDGQWHLLVVDLSTVEALTGAATYGRYDFFTGSSEKGIDVEYIAFFESAEKAEAYEAKLHPSVKEETEVIDLSTLANPQNTYMSSFPEAAINSPLFLLGYANTVELGAVDLSKYLSVTIYYCFDGTDATKTNCENSSSMAIGLKSENSSYGQETTDNFAGNIAHTDMVFSSQGWGNDIRAAVIDLSAIDYNGNVWVAVHNPQGTQIAITGIEFVVDPDYVPAPPFVKPSTPAEIVDAAYGLADGETLAEGPYTLTGVITSVDDAYSTQYSNITVTITVEGKAIKCYRMKGEGADDLIVGDTITVTGELTNYKGTIEFAQGCTLDAADRIDRPVVEEPDASIDFVEGNRTAATVDQLVYVADGITVTNNKADSTTDCRQDTDHVRLYTGSQLIIEYPGMTKLVFTCTGSKNITNNLTPDVAGTWAIEGNIATLTLDAPADKITFASLPAQIRLSNLAVYAAGSSEPAGPVHVLDAEDLSKHTGGDNSAIGVAGLTLGDGFVTATVNSTVNEAYYPVAIEPFNAAQYVVVKYRTNVSVACSMEIFAGNGTGAVGGDSCTGVALVTDGEWHYVILDLGTRRDNADVYNLNYIRFDVLNGKGIPAETTIDVAYMAFFAAEADAKAYGEASLVQPEPPAIEDGDETYKDYDGTYYAINEWMDLYTPVYTLIFAQGETAGTGTVTIDGDLAGIYNWTYTTAAGIVVDAAGQNFQIVTGIQGLMFQAGRFQCTLTTTLPEPPASGALTLGDNEVMVEDTWDGTPATFVAPEDGTYVFDNGKNLWLYVESEYGFVDLPYSVTLSAGEEFSFSVNAYDENPGVVVVNISKGEPAEDTRPKLTLGENTVKGGQQVIFTATEAGDYTFASNGLLKIAETWNGMEATLTLTLAAGETVALEVWDNDYAYADVTINVSEYVAPVEKLYPSHNEIEGHYNYNYDDVKAGGATLAKDVTSVTIKPGDTISFNNGWIGYGQATTKFGYRLSKTEEFNWCSDAKPEPAGSAVLFDSNAGPNGVRWNNVVSPAFNEEGTFYYEFGALLADGTIVSVHALEVIVEIPVFLKPATSDVLLGDAINVSFSSKNENGTDWIGIYKKGEDPTAGVNSIAWFNANSGETAFVPGKAASDTYFVNREADNALAAGEYTIYLFANGEYTILAQADVTVTSSVTELNLDLSSVTVNGGNYMADWRDAGYNGDDLIKFGFGTTATVTGVDLTKYSSVTITYGFDKGANAQGITKCIIGLRTDANWYGTAADSYALDKTLAYTNMVEVKDSWNAGKVSVTIDLTGVTHTGDFVIAISHPGANECVISNVVFNP